MALTGTRLNPSKPLDPLFNEAFIKVFGSQGSKSITRSLVNALLRAAGIEEIGDIDRIDSEHTAAGGTVDCKSPRLDVRLVAPGAIVDLESERHEGSLDNRLLLYGSRLLANAMGKGQDYESMPRVIVVVLYDAAVYFPETKAFVNRCGLLWDADGSSRSGSDRLQFVLVELRKFRARYNELNDQILEDEMLSWLYLLTSGWRNETESEAIMDAFPDIEEFAELYGFAAGDPKLVRAYEDYQSSILEENRRKRYYQQLKDEASEVALKKGIEQGRKLGFELGIEEGREEGRKEGREEGIEEGVDIASVATIKTLMKTMELSPEEAMDALEIPAEKRERYKAKL